MDWIKSPVVLLNFSWTFKLLALMSCCSQSSRMETFAYLSPQVIIVPCPRSMEILTLLVSDSDRHINTLSLNMISNTDLIRSTGRWDQEEVLQLDLKKKVKFRAGLATGSWLNYPAKINHFSFLVLKIAEMTLAKERSFQLTASVTCDFWLIQTVVRVSWSANAR